jgi:hypothetical protein
MGFPWEALHKGPTVWMDGWMDEVGGWWYQSRSKMDNSPMVGMWVGNMRKIN